MKSFTLLNYLIFVSIFSLTGIQSSKVLGKEIPQAGDKQIVSNRAADLLAQNDNTSIAKITGIKINSTDKGIEVILETANANNLQPVGKNEGNSLIADIPNAVLTLPDGEDFKVENPTEDITAISVTQVDEKNIRLKVTGKSGAPTVELFDNSQGLIFTLIPVPLTAQPPQQPTEETEESSQTPEPEQPPTSDENQSKPPAKDDEPIELVVTGEQDSYTVPNATTGTRTDTPLRDTPQSIQVIPRKIIDEQQALELDDVVRNASGVVSNSQDPRGQRFIIRGFSSSSVLRDGIRLTDGANGNIGFADLSNVERVEVLKGPAAILYGALEPGGVINLVNKQPLSEPYYNLNFRVGNRELIEPKIDISGPLTEDKRLLYRLNTVYRREESIRNFDVPIEKFFIAPTVSWKISDRTDITFNLEYNDDKRPADFAGIPAIGDRVADIPFDRITGEPDDDARNESLRVGYKFEHRFSDDWKVRNNFSFYDLDSDFIANIGPISAAFFNETTGDINRLYLQNRQTAKNLELQTNVVGKFSTGSLKHTLLAGVDLVRRDAATFRRIDFSPQPVFNIFNPVYGLVSRPDSFDDNPPKTRELRTDSLGIYLQDQIKVGNNFHILAGIRYDTVDQEDDDLENNTSSSQNDDAFSPRIGFLYQPTKELSLYTSYSTSFAPNSGETRSGDILEPERGEQFEIGIRAELLKGGLVANLAFFDITKKNVSTGDPSNDAGETFVVAVGEQRSRGIELDLIGKILPGWNIVANYAYTDADITEDNTSIEGNRLFGVPEHNFNLWTTYEIQQGSLKGLAVSLGFNFVDERFGDNDNSFVLES
ncbi:TonB-dependent siderophore receptor, partial [Calothrix rhizosoleniae]|uniref:TonB-dependent siderophore receptor n=1 Tax=Calothrix rhizosoleniae TaxID=888997 RepID=UPI00117812D1